jgi:hypothetical protein
VSPIEAAISAFQINKENEVNVNINIEEKEVTLCLKIKY